MIFFRVRFRRVSSETGRTLVMFVAAVVKPQSLAFAATFLVFDQDQTPVNNHRPLIWNVIGLDSNNVNVGPNDFPVGARTCNNGGSTPKSPIFASYGMIARGPSPAAVPQPMPTSICVTVQRMYLPHTALHYPWRLEPASMLILKSG